VTRSTGTTPGRDEARFPGFDVLDSQPAWDRVTAGVVLARLGPVEPLAFFTADEAPTAAALLDRLLGQDDEPRVPVLPVIDRRLALGDGDGYRYDDLPEDGEAWRRSIAGLDADAHDAFGSRFHELDRDRQMAIVEEVRVDEGRWRGLPAGRLFSLWMRYACAAFYAHPWAWNEIGFSGPAYPRGYANLSIGGREHWERPERDAEDPIPWARRTEQAKRAHAEGLTRGKPDD
jgi:hypothetical protein